MKEKFVLVYDADCGPCTMFKRAVDFLDTYNKLNFTSLIEADNGGLLNSVPNVRRHRSFHLISPQGSVQSGASAIPELLSLFPFGKVVSKLVILAPCGSRIINFLYSTFSRLHDSGACAYERPKHSFSAKGEVKESRRNKQQFN